jgi:hypothetical protein
MGHPGEESRETAYVFRRANELAPTGRHIDYLTIETEIIQEGYPEARDWLDRDNLRRDLKAIYDRSRRTKGLAMPRGPKREETG